MDIIGIENFTFRYPGEEKDALSGVTLHARRGEFITLCGESGSGKTTLLKNLKPPVAPFGQRSGAIFFGGGALWDMDSRRQAAEIGFVGQDPENQIVTDKVWHELAFGLENLGAESSAIRLRVAELSAFFGIENWFDRDTWSLSGGEKQILSLASVMAMSPEVLVLDEPTAYLDPMAAEEFLSSLARINRDLGVTVILSEQRLESALPLSDRVWVMDGGRVIADASPGEAGAYLKKIGHPMFEAMPAPMRIYTGTGPLPVTVREGREWLDSLGLPPEEPAPGKAEKPAGEPVLSLKELWFRYGKKEKDVLKGLSLDIRSGEVLAVCGGNGAGKTTLLNILAGNIAPYAGKVRASDKSLKTALLPQNPETLFLKSTLEQEYMAALSGRPLTEDGKKRLIMEKARLTETEGLLSRHPFDLSGGEKQRAALCRVLLSGPDALLLDEPTKGMDARHKAMLGGILSELAADGAAVVIVTHDVEFAAEWAMRCALVFDGAVVSEGAPAEFFAGNGFYTTSANRMARHVFPSAITAKEVREKIQGLWSLGSPRGLTRGEKEEQRSGRISGRFLVRKKL